MQKGLEFMVNMRKLCVKKALEARKAQKPDIVTYYLKKARYWRRQLNLAQRATQG